MKKDKKKNNVVLKGIEAHTKNEQINSNAIEKFKKDKLNLDIKINGVKQIKTKWDRLMVIAKCETFEQKLQVMKATNKLKGIAYYIEDELSPDEIKLQEKLRNLARKEWGKQKNSKDRT
ncbi:hypothetical protein ILUMI_26508 [Ignelater luminosus]|uniref:Uncharacterized protein n=1 Tax=Ignelater luminosus TaxID=2038154 RepID=A0A8K0C6E2_IGNLU|nr:hypothetical protein ILUMI_26508 [Ignelater luminosus]